MCSQDADADLAAAIAASMQHVPSSSQPARLNGAGTPPATAPSAAARKPSPPLDSAPGMAAASADAHGSTSSTPQNVGAASASAQGDSAAASTSQGAHAPSGAEPSSARVHVRASTAGQAPELLAGSSQGQEPAAGPHVCELSVRAPGNAALQRRFLAEDTLGGVCAWLQGAGWDMLRHHLRFGFPPRVATDMSATLKSVGICKRERLLLEARRL